MRPLDSSSEAPATGGPRRLILWALIAALAVHGAAQAWLLLAHQPLGVALLPDWTAGRIAFAQPQDLYRFDLITRLQAWASGDHEGARPFLPAERPDPLRARGQAALHGLL